MKELLCGIDIGTTGSKAILIDTAGVVRATAVSEYPMHTPQPLWAEQNPEDWWQATVQSIRSVMDKSGATPGDIAGIGLTGQMHGLVLLDAQGEVLRPCIMWNDQRTAAECAEITGKVGGEKILTITGNPVLPGFTAPKILWVKHREPGVYARVAKFLLPKDYIRYRLTGVFAGDVSDSSGTSLFDVRARKWSQEMLAALDIPKSWCADITESPVASAKVTADAARGTGLLQGTPVVAGAGDQAAQAVGTGIISEGIVAVTVGTSGVVFASSDTYRVEPRGRLHAFCHAVPGRWHLMGVMLSAGGSFRWYRDTFGDSEKLAATAQHRDAYDVLIEPAAAIVPGSDGLLFLPYLTGERTPYPDPYARGVFFGMTVRHTKPHFTRAVLEGVTFGLRDSLELMRTLGIPLSQIRASGGGARNATWRQIMADIFAAELVTVNSTEGAAFGAALLAGVGASVYPTVDRACSAAIATTGSTAPGSAVARYDQFYRRYQALYPLLAPEFKRLGDLAGA